MNKTLENFLRDTLDAKVLKIENQENIYTKLDLSIFNNEFVDLNLKTPSDFENYITNILISKHANIAFGGYLEKRNLYRRSTIFGSDLEPERNIHIGIDLWTNAGTTVLAAIDGTIHSFQNNLGLGNYGPTIILEHHVDNLTFYTLYGHLSKNSISTLKIGDFYKMGQPVAKLGTSSENGDYAPHLHFQIIQNMANYFGDYPGVCNQNDLEYYSNNCPNPEILLKLEF